MMRVLVACEYSGTVRDAFIRAGHDAMSCDLLPTDAPGPHYQGDVRDLLLPGLWDLLIAHPPVLTSPTLRPGASKKLPENDRRRECFMEQPAAWRSWKLWSWSRLCGMRPSRASASRIRKAASTPSCHSCQGRRWYSRMSSGTTPARAPVCGWT